MTGNHAQSSPPPLFSSVKNVDVWTSWGQKVNTLWFPHEHTSASLCPSPHQSVYCRLIPAALQHAGKCPFDPTTSMTSDLLWRKPSPSYDEACMMCRRLPPSLCLWVSPPLLQKWEPGFPMSRRRDADHSRLSPLPSPTENNHRRLDWPIVQQVEKSARKAAWGDNPAKATLQRVLWGTVHR